MVKSTCSSLGYLQSQASRSDDHACAQLSSPHRGHVYQRNLEFRVSVYRFRGTPPCAVLEVVLDGRGAICEQRVGQMRLTYLFTVNAATLFTAYSIATTVDSDLS